MGDNADEALSTSKSCVICSESGTEVLHETQTTRIIWGAGSNGAATKVGHVMVVPRRHAQQIGDLTPDETVDLVHGVYVAMKASYRAWYTASSWGKWGLGLEASANIGFNFGPHGDDPLGMNGQDHLHVHVVPRNPNDTNFMWWSSRAAILHIKDNPMRQAMVEELAALQPEPSTEALPETGCVAPPSPASTAPPPATPTFVFNDPPRDTCPLCKEWDALRATQVGRVLFSIKPYKYGHVMVIPNRHVATLDLCTADEVAGVMQLVAEAAAVVMEATGSPSYSVGINHGPHSGASIPSHLHIHIIPRYHNDCSVTYWSEAELQYGSLDKPDKVRQVFVRRFGEPDITELR